MAIRYIIKHLLFFILLLNSNFLSSQSHRIRIYASELELIDLGEKGVPLDHGFLRKGFYFESEFDAQTLKIIKESGVSYEEVLPKKAPRLLNEILPSLRLPAINAISPIAGSLGGFVTYDEFLNKMGELENKFPNLISPKEALPNIQTSEGRELYLWKISDHPTVEEGEPKILYTAIHHAREPASLMQLLYFIEYLLENSEGNELVNELLTSNQLYFVPVVNPDGYVYNGQIASNGGGLWRKNRRPLPDGNYGVDLNRNYDSEFNTTGVSSYTGSPVYPGTHAFSEKETQAIRNLCSAVEFDVAVNAHSSGNYLLYPYGYLNVPAADENRFTSTTSNLFQLNGYLDIQSADLYAASGDASDWMYDAYNVLAITLEVGGRWDGFWPKSNRIENLCRENILPNLRIAQMATGFADFESIDVPFYPDENSTLNYQLNHVGWQSSASYSVDFKSIDNRVQLNVSQEINFDQIGVKQNAVNFSWVNEELSVVPVGIEVRVRNAEILISIDTIYLYHSYSSQLTLLDEDLDSWQSDTWGMQLGNAQNGGSTIEDSPNSFYDNSDTRILLSPIYSVNDLQGCYLDYYAKWNLERDLDFVQFQYRLDNGEWMAVHVAGRVAQSEEGVVAAYSDNQISWEREKSNLIFNTASQIQFRWILESDPFVPREGFSLDNMRILIPDIGNSIQTYNNFDVQLDKIANSKYLIKASGQNIFGYQLYSLDGKLVVETKEFRNQTILLLDNLNDGLYLLKVIDNSSKASVSKKIVHTNFSR